MSCCPPSCDPENEPLASALTNFIQSFYGTVTKTCVDGVVVWSLPCDLDTGNPNLPRNPGEGLACYFLRYIQTVVVGPTGATGPQGPAGNPLAAGTGFTGTVDVVLDVSFTSPDLIQQKQTLTYNNGLLTAIGVPFNQVITTAAACP